MSNAPKLLNLALGKSKVFMKRLCIIIGRNEKWAECVLINAIILKRFLRNTHKYNGHSYLCMSRCGKEKMKKVLKVCKI